MKQLFTLRCLCLFLLGGIILFGCVERDLIRVDISNNQLELTAIWPEGVSPQGAKLIVYDQNGARLKEFDISGTERIFRCDFETGSYKIIMYNTDSQNSYIKQTEDYSLVGVYAHEYGIPDTGTELTQPNNIFGTGSIDQGGMLTVATGQNNSYTATAKRLTHKATFYFKITGVDAVSEVKGRLDGISPGILLGLGQAVSTSCFLPYMASYLPPQSSQSSAYRAQSKSEPVWYGASVEFFDLMAQVTPESEDATQLYIEVIDGQGKVYSVTKNITSVIRDIMVENEGFLPIEIPLEIDFKVNFTTNEVNASVEPWDETGTGGGKPEQTLPN